MNRRDLGAGSACTGRDDATRRQHEDGGGQPARAAADLSGLSVLVLEDEFLIAIDLQDMMAEWGFGTVLVAGTLEEARAALPAEGVDVLLADLNVTGEFSGDLIAELNARGTAVVVLTGQVIEPEVLAEIGNPPVAEKPVQRAHLRAIVEAALAAR